ncbi:MAG: hypothetical protein ACYS76_16330, partial [Planctomycetota bacterium]
MCKKLMFLISLVLVLGLVNSALATEYRWTAGYYPFSMLWTSPQNWDPEGVPGPGDYARIDPDYVLPPADPTMGPVVDVNVTIDRMGGPARDNGVQEMHVTAGLLRITNEWDREDGGDRGTVYISGDGAILREGSMRVFDQGGFVLDLSDNGSFECTGNLR